MTEVSDVPKGPGATQDEMGRAQAHMFSLAGRILDTCGPRLTGSASVREAAALLRQAMTGWADQVSSHTFPVRPQAYLAWTRLVVVLYGGGLAAAWLGYGGGAPVLGWSVAALAGIVGLGAVLGEAIFLREVLEPFYPEVEGENVLGVLEPSHEVRAQVIVSGHHDSAREFTFLAHGSRLYPLRITAAFFSLCLFTGVAFVYAVSSLAAPLPYELLALGTLTVLFPLVLPMWRFAKRDGVPGAGDNLVSSTLTVALGELFAERRAAGRGLNHTRLVLASWDAEECGLRGARAYTRDHAETLRAVPTTVLNLECLYRADELAFLTSDVHGMTSLSGALASEGVTAAAEVGVAARRTPMIFLGGATDATEFAKVGCEATTLLGMSFMSVPRRGIYHTPKDTLDKVEPEAVRAAFATLVRLIERHDQALHAPSS